MKKRSGQWLAALLALCLLAACGGEKATDMRLERTEGSVSVQDGAAKDVAVREDLGLYSGYQIGTQAESFAWMALDAAKLAKLDESSETAVLQQGGALTLEVRRGSLYFNVTEPLPEEETLCITRANMTVGIRGTCGWVETPDDRHMNVFLLKGTVECTAGSAAERLEAGMMAALDGEAGVIALRALTREEIPAFVEAEVTDELLDSIPSGAQDDEDGGDDEDDDAQDAGGQTPEELLRGLQARASGGEKIHIIHIADTGAPEIEEPAEAMGFLSGALVDFDGDGADGLVTVSGDSARSLLVETYDKNGAKVSEASGSFYGSAEYGGGDSTFDVLLCQDPATQQWRLLFQNTIRSSVMNVFEASLYTIAGDGGLQYQDRWYWDDLSGTGGTNGNGVPDALAADLQAAGWQDGAAVLHLFRAQVLREDRDRYLHIFSQEELSALS